jgi:hypothetical protein
MQHVLFGVEPQYGLVDCIKGGESLENALTRVPGISCLSLLCAGEPPPTPRSCSGVSHSAT